MRRFGDSVHLSWEKVTVLERWNRLSDGWDACARPPSLKLRVPRVAQGLILAILPVHGGMISG